MAKGYSDRKLLRLSKRPFWEKGMAPWHAWESERTGFGLGLRIGGFYPPFFPLFLKSDHYANPITEIRDNEGKDNLTQTYLTWNPHKAKKMNDAGYLAYCVKHPWHYLNLPRYEPGSGTGTLVFLPHSHGSLRSEFDWNKIKSELSKIPQEAQPLTICIGEQDVQKGLLAEVRDNLRLPIVSAGELTSQFFPFRLWRLFAKHSYTAGFNVASHSIYAIWSGRSYFLLDDTSFSFQIKDGQAQWREFSHEENFRKSYDDDKVAEEARELGLSFREFRYSPSEQQKNFVKKYVVSEHSINRLSLCKVLWVSFVRRFVTVLRKT